MDSLGQISELLRAHARGSDGALDDLFSAVYGELRRLSRRELAHAGARRSLDSAALVHELYLKCAASARGGWDDRRHFFGTAARAMRHIVIDYARQKAAVKRGGGIPLCDSVVFATQEEGVDLIEVLALDRVLTGLEQFDEQLAQLVQLRFFAGLSVEDTAVVLAVDPRTVRRRWRRARAYLNRELRK